MEAAATAPVWESQLEQRMGMDEWEMAEFRMELASKAAIGMKKHPMVTSRADYRRASAVYQREDLRTPTPWQITCVASIEMLSRAFSPVSTVHDVYLLHMHINTTTCIIYHIG